MSFFLDSDARNCFRLDDPGRSWDNAGRAPSGVLTLLSTPECSTHWNDAPAAAAVAAKRITVLGSLPASCYNESAEPALQGAGNSSGPPWDVSESDE